MFFKSLYCWNTVKWNCFSAGLEWFTSICLYTSLLIIPLIRARVLSIPYRTSPKLSGIHHRVLPSARNNVDGVIHYTDAYPTIFHSQQITVKEIYLTKTPFASLMPSNERGRMSIWIFIGFLRTKKVFWRKYYRVNLVPLVYDSLSTSRFLFIHSSNLQKSQRCY